MTVLNGINLAADAVTLSPVALFLQADIVVKTVIVGLLLASIHVWATIISHGRNIGKIIRENVQFERQFRRTRSTEKFYGANAKNNPLPMARILVAAMNEWHKSAQGAVADRSALSERLSMAMNAAATVEIDRFSEKIAILATIGSVAPFVGLFGTVWGIMRAFTNIAVQNNSSLAVVAPGIAEALFATAIGLFAAIPAVIAYNSFAQKLNRLDSHMARFTDEIHAVLSHKLEAH